MIPLLSTCIRAFVVWALAAPLGLAQLSLSYGPTNAPFGCPIRYTIDNEGPVAVDWDPCGFSVYDALGQLVHTTVPCPGPVTLQPGALSTSTWLQTDLAGNQVPAGTYFLNSPTGVPVVVGTAQTAIGPLGTLRRGRTRGLQLSSPQDPGARYLLLASDSMTTGFATCGGHVPLDEGRILFASVANPVVFRRFSGRLDANGLSVDPALAVPDDPRLAGTAVHFTFLVLDAQAACRVRRISETATFTIL